MNNKLITKRNIILTLTIAILVTAIPLTVKLVQTQQQLRSKAAGTLTGSFTPLESGEYKVVVNAYDSSGRACSGNPFGLPAGWSDCGTQDNVTVIAATPIRPALCSSTVIDNNNFGATLDPGESITIKSTAKQAVTKFMFAFYNNGNTDPIVGPLGIDHDQDTTNGFFTPTDTVSQRSQYSKTFSYEELAVPDYNWGGAIPTQVQVNGYFFDDQNNQSAADVNCVVNFNLNAQ